MSSRIREHIRSNVYGLLALFVALSGTAIASQQADRNSVVSSSIKNRQVKKGTWPRARSPGSRSPTARSRERDIDEATIEGLGRPVGRAGGELTGSYPNPSIAANVRRGRLG